MKNSGSQFLHDRNPDFQNSREVEDVVGFLRKAGDAIPNQPGDKIAAYLGFLAHKDYVDDGILTGSEPSVQRQVEARVIQADEVPEGYFELQRRIAREQGHGDIELSEDDRQRMIESIQSDQRAGLHKWIEYIGGDDGSYPDWFKYYAFESVTKLGSFNKDKHEFARRSKGTTTAYPELNREALAYVYDVLHKSKVEGNAQIGDASLQNLLENANFGKLYAHAILEVTPDSPELRYSTEGRWTLYDQTQDPRTARRLASSLQGHGTGWCTAGESTAQAQLNGGDFYVYYTRDEDNKDTIPRVAIRMENGQVAEVRGINADQNLEGVMADIAMDKLRELPGGAEYQKKADDMKHLTDIEKQLQKNPNAQLAVADIRFLYELDHSIQGFGYERDPRIDTIRKLRGERDLPELTTLLPEVIRDQVEGAFRAYEEVTSILNVRAADRASFAATMLDKEGQWSEQGVYEFLARELIEGGGGPNLVVTPNILADSKDISLLARQFGKKQPYETYEYKELYDQLSAEELSGLLTNEPVRLSLISSGYTKQLGTSSVAEQRQALETMQSEHPRLNLRVPTVLESINYWFALREKDGSLVGEDIFDKTYIRHFDLAERRTSGGRSVFPDSYVVERGRASLSVSYVGSEDGARVSVG